MLAQERETLAATDDALRAFTGTPPCAQSRSSIHPVNSIHFLVAAVKHAAETTEAMVVQPPPRRRRPYC